MRGVPKLPTQVQADIMNVVERLCAHYGDLYRKGELKFPYPTSAEVHRLRETEGTINGTRSTLKSLAQKGWLGKMEKGKETAFFPTDRWIEIKSLVATGDIRLGFKLVKTTATSLCDQCAQERSLTLYKGQLLCRDCLCPDEDLKAVDIGYKYSMLANMEEIPYGT